MTEESRRRLRGLAERDAVQGDIVSVVENLDKRLRRLEKSFPGTPGQGAGTLAFYDNDGILDASVGGVRTIVSENNVSNPPTNAQLDTAFGQPEDLGDGFIGVVFDNGGTTAVWLCVVALTTWQYERLSTA